MKISTVVSSLSQIATRGHALLTGLTDDDHTQYLDVTRHDTTSRHTLGTVVPREWTILTKTSEQSVNNSTVLVADNQLTFTPAASGLYHIRGMVIYQATAVAHLKLRLAVDQVRDSHGWSSYRSVTPADVLDHRKSNDDILAQGGGSGVLRVVMLEMFVNCDSGVAVIQIQFAQQSQEATNTTLMPNSRLEYRRLD